jgi:hypothetical protein
MISFSSRDGIQHTASRRFEARFGSKEQSPLQGFQKKGYVLTPSQKDLRAQGF